MQDKAFGLCPQAQQSGNWLVGSAPSAPLRVISLFWEPPGFILTPYLVAGGAQEPTSPKEAAYSMRPSFLVKHLEAWVYLQDSLHFESKTKKTIKAKNKYLQWQHGH